jgi:hypothetical protein
MLRKSAQAGFFFCLLACALLGGRGLARAEDKPAEPGQAKTGRWLLLPVLGYSPETRIILGLGGVYYFRPAGSRPEARPSQVWIAAIGTQNKQFMLWLLPELYLRNETLRIVGSLKLENYPQKFYGVGNDTADEVEEDYSYRRAYLELTALRKIRSRFFGGLYYEFETGRIAKPKPGGLLDRGEIPGTGTTTISGAGLAAAWDSRDSIFFPRRGSYHQAWLSGYSGILGSEYDFIRLKFDLRHYIPVFSSHVLALQAMVRLISGQPPFQFMGMIGGDTLMRGYYLGRYRDKNLIILQAEYRMPVWWRFGLAGFVGVGDVAAKPGKFRLGSFKYTAGFGLRFLFDAKEKTYIRVDFGFGKNTSGMYIMVGEAF